MCSENNGKNISTLILEVFVQYVSNYLVRLCFHAKVLCKPRSLLKIFFRCLLITSLFFCFCWLISAKAWPFRGEKVTLVRPLTSAWCSARYKASVEFSFPSSWIFWKQNKLLKQTRVTMRLETVCLHFIALSPILSKTLFAGCQHFYLLSYI